MTTSIATPAKEGSSNGSSTKQAKVAITPPDGGWGWVVVFASLMIHVVTDGVTYSFGVLFKEFTKVFNVGDQEGSWVISILVGVTLCSGPISSAFVNKYGCRTVTIAGAILGSACLAVSVLATKVTTLYFTIGLGTGLGFGLIYLPAIVSVTCYFERYRSLATGIAVCGSGLGTIIFSPVIDYLIERYDWKVTLLILSALVLGCVVFGILFRPLEEVDYKTIEANPINYVIKLENVDIPDSIVDQKTLSTHNLSNKENQLVVSNGHGPNKRPHSVHGHIIAVTEPQRNGNGVMSNNINGVSSPNHIKPNNLDDTKFALSQPLLWENGNATIGRSNIAITKSNKHLSASTHGGSGLMHKKDILYFGSIKHIADDSSSTNLNDSKLVVHSPKESTVMMLQPEQTIQYDDQKEPEGCLSAETRQTLKEMLDMELLKDPIFILFTISNIFTSLGFNIPYIYLVKKAETHGITNGSTLLSVVGGANLLSRLILGYISDKPYANRLYIYNSCLAICGIATFLCAYCDTFISLVIYSLFFGSMIGAYVGLTSVILVDLLGLDRLTNAFGLLLLFQGIASLIGPPIGGFLYDTYESYKPAFFMAGSFIFFSGVMLFVIPSLQRYLEKKKQKTTLSDS